MRLQSYFIKIFCEYLAQEKKGVIISNDIITELFFGCENVPDCHETLKVLIENSNLLTKWSFMTVQKQSTTNIETLTVRLKIRVKLFERVPTATNMLLAFNLIEEIMLKVFQEGKDISDEVNKRIEKFDKCKILALGTKFIHERKLAFSRSVDIFTKLTDVKL